MRIEKDVHSFKLKSPFAITGHVFDAINTLGITLKHNGCRGRGEAVGVYFKNETPHSMKEQIENLNLPIGKELTHEFLLKTLPSGGARNAIDCALWDLKAKCANATIWELLNIKPKALSSVATISIDTPEMMAKKAIHFSKYDKLKVKLSIDEPIVCLKAIRAVRPDASIIIDVNQGWTFEELIKFTPCLERLDIAMIEQPLPRGGDECLEGYKSAIPLAADESCLDTYEYTRISNRYDVINIKLDKCGGLTEGLKLVELAKRDNKGLMIGNMMGSSLSMAPAYVIGQFCQYVDIDGPLFLAQDIKDGLAYRNGVVDLPETKLWG